ncbi:hypothetical protein Esti_000627 [Eimeria stiedai]
MASVPVAEHNLACLSTVPAGPKWTFGGRSSRPSSSPVPGPGAYNPHFEISRQSAPQYGFGSGKRGSCARGRAGDPGPGTYQPKFRVGRQAASWTMAGKTPIPGSRNVTPGPGAYANVIPKSTAPSYGVGTSSRGAFSAPALPGPGTYNTGGYFGGQSPQWTLGSSQRSSFTPRKLGSPGPGTYSPDALTGKGPMYSMGARPPARNQDQIPGPGAYTPRCLEKEANKFSFGMKTPLSRGGGDAPGPGAYNPAEVTVRRRPPAWGFGNSRRGSFAANACPGPGEYNPEKKSVTPSWSFGSEAKMRGQVSGTDTPAPGTYSLGTTVGQGIKYSIAGGGRQGMAITSDTPGPSTYAPAVSDGSPKWSFGSSTKTSLAPPSISPGPGAYSMSTARDGVGWTMSGRHGGSTTEGIKKPVGGSDKIGTTDLLFEMLSLRTYVSLYASSGQEKPFLEQNPVATTRGLASHAHALLVESGYAPSTKGEKSAMISLVASVVGHLSYSHAFHRLDEKVSLHPLAD